MAAPKRKDEHVTLITQNQAVTQADDEIYRARSFLPKALELHAKYPLMDGHNDLPWAIKAGFDNDLAVAPDLNVNQKGVKFDGIRHGCLHTDIPRLREGGAGAQFWSVYIPTSITGPEAIHQTMEQIDLVHRLCEKYPDTLEFAETAADIRRIFQAGKIASVCGLEGGHQINESLACLRMFHRLGCRYMTLTHNGGPGWCDAAVERDGTFAEAHVGGLTPYGVEVIAEMNRVGMVVDISHVHEVAMNRVLDVTKAPVLFSHSSSKAICAHPRDVSDDVLLRLKENGGVIMVNISSNFIAGPFYVRGGKVGATLLEVADHIDHIKSVIGWEHIGIGADYDGILSPARGMEDVSKVPLLTAELLHRGYQEEEIGGILGLNAIRVLEKCEQVAKKLQATTEPSEAKRKVLDKDISAEFGAAAAEEEDADRGVGEPAAKKAKGQPLV